MIDEGMGGMCLCMLLKALNFNSNFFVCFFFKCRQFGGTEWLNGQKKRKRKGKKSTYVFEKE